MTHGSEILILEYCSGFFWICINEEITVGFFKSVEEAMVYTQALNNEFSAPEMMENPLLDT